VLILLDMAGLELLEKDGLSFVGLKVIVSMTLSADF